MRLPAIVRNARQFVADIKDFANIMRAEAGRAVRMFTRYGLPPRVNQEELVKRYMGWVYTCCTINATGVASTPLRLYAGRPSGASRVKGFPARVLTKHEVHDLMRRSSAHTLTQVKAAIEIEEIYDHPALELVMHPNNDDNGYEMLELTSVLMDLTGNGYWAMNLGPMGVPTQLKVLRSQLVRIVPDADGNVRGYLFGRQPDPEPFAADEVIQFKYPNPLDPYYGMGPTQAAAWAIDRQTGMDQFEKATLDNMGRPDFIIKYLKGRLSKRERIDLEREWGRAMAGRNNAGRFKVMDHEWDLKEFGWSPRDMAFLQGRPWTMKEICAVNNVPVALVDTKDVNKANAEVAEMFLAKYGTRPRLRRIEQKLSEQLAPLFDARLFFAFDDPVRKDRELILKEDTEYIKAAVRTVNEVRNDHGWESVQWGDVPILPLSSVPLGSPPPAPTPAPAPPHNEGKQHKGRAPHYWLKGDPDPRSGGRNPRVSDEEKGLIRTVEDVWDRQEKEIVGNIDKALKGDAPLLDKQKWDREVADLTEDHLWTPSQRGGNAALRQIGMKLPEWVESPEYIQAMRNEAFEFANYLNSDTMRQFNDVMEQAAKEGLSVQRIKSRLEAIVPDWKNKKRSLMIARTETARAFTAGKIEAWKQSDVVTGKRWDASGDACPFCLEMNGKVVELDAPYWEKGETMSVPFGKDDNEIRLNFGYSAVAGPPLHPNCRCDVLAVVD